MPHIKICFLHLIGSEESPDRLLFIEKVLGLDDPGKSQHRLGPVFTLLQKRAFFSDETFIATMFPPHIRGLECINVGEV
jgi:hypothetical protein